MICKSMMSLTAVFATAVLASAVSAQTPPPAAAQTTPDQDPPGLEAQLRAKGEAYSRAPDSEQNPAEVSATARLNSEVAARNEAAEMMEARSVAESEEATIRADAETVAAAARYEVDRAAYEAAHADYMRARGVWEGLLQACVASGRTDCTPM